jgi:REP element-mobilizing transposase RayT
MKKRKRHVQLDLEQARRCGPGHGGWRPGAGRKRRATGVPHEVRDAVRADQPQHVTVRLVEGVSIRKQWLMPTIHGAIADSQRPDFRIVEFNVLGNHIHLVAEADGAAALGNGMNGFEARLAKRLNRALRRSGTVFDGRYHVRALRTPTEVRNALRYVLLNARHHAADAGRTLDRGWIDSYSSAPWFDGWSAPVRVEPHIALPPRPTAAASTWLLRTGWRRFGLLSPDEVPGQRTPHPAPRPAARRPMPTRRSTRPSLVPAQLGFAAPRLDPSLEAAAATPR